MAKVSALLGRILKAGPWFALALASGTATVPDVHGFDIPARTGWVVDQTGVLTRATAGNLNQRLEQLQSRGGAQLQVVIVSTLGGEPIESAALKIAEAYRLGHAGKDNGALLLVALQDREMRIEVGRGLEGALPDALAGRIIRRVITPEFKAGRFEAGIVAGVQEIAQITVGEDLSVPGAQRPHRGPIRKVSPGLMLLVFLLWGIVAIALRMTPAGRMILRHGQTRVRTGGWGGGSGWGGGGGWSSGGGGGFSGGGASGRW
jgi:uncharacterized protein